MVKIRLKNILLIVSFLLMDIFYVYGDEEINLHHIERILGMEDCSLSSYRANFPAEYDYR